MTDLQTIPSLDRAVVSLRRAAGVLRTMRAAAEDTDASVGLVDAADAADAAEYLLHAAMCEVETWAGLHDAKTA